MEMAPRLVWQEKKPADSWMYIAHKVVPERAKFRSGAIDPHAACLLDQARILAEMTDSGIGRLAELISNPPPGSKIEAAIQFGVDLSLNLRALQLTPDERVREMERALRFAEALQQAERIER